MVAAFREELLAQEYVRLETTDVRLDDAKLRAYYDAHLADFGQKQVRRYELLKGLAPETGQSTTKSLALLGELAKRGAKESTWSEFARRADVRAAGITFARGDLEPGALQPRVRQLIVERVPYLARVTELAALEARPFGEVRMQVFERVRAAELKAALERLKGAVLGKVKVEYVTPVKDLAFQKASAPEAK
jgi:hypothetical protein